MSSSWKLPDGRTIILQTQQEFNNLPDGILMIDIFGKEYIKGQDYIDQDTRFGHLAVGLPDGKITKRKVDTSVIKITDLDDLGFLAP